MNVMSTLSPVGSWKSGSSNSCFNPNTKLLAAEVLKLGIMSSFIADASTNKAGYTA